MLRNVPNNLLISLFECISGKYWIDIFGVNCSHFVHPPVSSVMTNDVFYSGGYVVQRTIDQFFSHSLLNGRGLFNPQPLNDRSDSRTCSKLVVNTVSVSPDESLYLE